MKSTLPQATPRTRRCTEIQMRWSPSGSKLQFSLAGFELCWNTWASPPLPDTGSRKSRVQGGWSSKPSQRSSSNPESSTVADAAWQAITSWVPSNKSRLQNSVHYLLPYRKKDQFKAYGVKKDIPRMEMVHHQDATVELSTRLLAAQREIETLHI
jgi:hypothetical protein